MGGFLLSKKMAGPSNEYDSCCEGYIVSMETILAKPINFHSKYYRLNSY